MLHSRRNAHTTRMRCLSVCATSTQIAQVQNSRYIFISFTTVYGSCRPCPHCCLYVLSSDSVCTGTGQRIIFSLLHLHNTSCRYFFCTYPSRELLARAIYYAYLNSVIAIIRTIMNTFVSTSYKTPILRRHPVPRLVLPTIVAACRRHPG